MRVTSVYPGGTATDLLHSVRSAFGRPYDPEECIRPETLAAPLMTILELRADAYVPELSLLPAPGRTPRPGPS